MHREILSPASCVQGMKDKNTMQNHVYMVLCNNVRLNYCATYINRGRTPGQEFLASG
jgi:hypothetical protein